MAPNPTTTVKFLCSYGGRIIPRYPDGKLRYHGGDTRIISVSRFVSFNELSRKLGEICGTTMSFRCQLPTHDLDELITVSSDEDLVNLMEEYDLTSTAQVKIRAFLFPLKSTTNSSPPLKSTASSCCSSSSSSKSSSRSPPSPSTRPICVERSMHNKGCYVHRSPSQNQFYLIHN